MQARDIMTHEVITISPTATGQTLARLLVDYNISGVPVVTEAGHIVGIVTQFDLLYNQAYDDPDRPVADLMTSRVISVDEQTPVDEIAQILTSNRIKRVPVLHGDRLVGIVSRANIVRILASRWVCPVCGEVQHGSMPNECFSCGADGHRFERELDPRPEITTRQ